jgi:uncharacterized protein (UPF0335 family)
MRPSEELREYVNSHYQSNSRAARQLLAIADKVERLEQAASPVTGDTP